MSTNGTPQRSRGGPRVAVADRGHPDLESPGDRRQNPIEAEPSIWNNHHFLLLWLAQAISQTAQNAIWYGIVVLVQRISNSSTQLSLAVLTLIIPSVIFGVLAGVYVDRWDKRGVLIATNLIRGGIAFSELLAILSLLVPATVMLVGIRALIGSAGIGLSSPWTSAA